jgi:ankyrin repeat protein
MKHTNSALSLLFVGSLIIASSSCSALSKLGEKTIGETFSDEKVVALVEAALAGDAEKITSLEKQGANVNAIADNGATPLFWALNARNHRGVKALLTAGADPNLVTEKTGMSSMNFVPMGDDPELLRLLLKFGGNPNHPGSGKIDDRPLSLAASEGRIENVKLLLDAGADINAHDNFDESAATKTLALGNFETAAFLIQHGFNYNLEYLARRVRVCHVPKNSDAQRWKEKVIVLLKERGITLNP